MQRSQEKKVKNIMNESSLEKVSIEKASEDLGVEIIDQATLQKMLSL